MAIRANGGEVITVYSSDLKGLERGAKRAEQINEQYVKKTRNLMRGLGDVLRGKGSDKEGFLPGLANLSEIIQGIPQVGRLIGGLVSPFTQATEAGIRFNMFMETAEVGFEGLLGSGERARRFLGDLQGFAERTPFEFTGLVKSSRYMSTFGFSIDELIPKLTTWGNVISATGDISEEALEGIVRGFGQMRIKGRASLEEINQLSERGFPALELLAKAIGKTEGETVKLIERGRIRGGAAVEAITAMAAEDPRFKGQMDRMSRTLAGRLSNVEDIRARAGGLATQNLTKDLSDAIGGALTQSDLAESMAGNINTAIAPFSKVFKAAVVGAVGGGITSGMAEGIQATKEVVFGAVKELGLGALLTMRSVLDSHSPSLAFKAIGTDAGLGFALGLRDSLKRLAAENGGDLRKYLEQLAQDPRVKAWFEEIRRVEGGRPDIMAGGRRVKSGPRHPGEIVPRDEWYQGPKGRSSAAGNWQMTLTNWRQIAPALGLDNFSDVNQQLIAALALFAEKGGDKALLAGDFTGALKASAPWAATPLSHLPGAKPANSKQFLEQYGQILAGMTGGAVPVRVVGTDGGSMQPFTDAMAKHIEDLGFGPDTALPQSRITQAGLLGSLQLQSAVAGFAAAIPNTSEATFNLLAAIGRLGPEAQANFGQGAQAARDWAKEVINAEKRTSFLGITAKDASGAFQQAWSSAFTRTDLDFRGLMSNFVLSFADALNSMIQQWAAARIAKGVGDFIGALFGGGFPAGGTTQGGILGSLPFGSTAAGYASGTTSAPPGLAWVGERGPELVKFRGGERVYNNQESRGMVKSQGVTHITYNITMPPTPNRSYVPRRSQRELAETLTGAIKTRI